MFLRFSRLALLTFTALLVVQFAADGRQQHGGGDFTEVWGSRYIASSRRHDPHQRRSSRPDVVRRWNEIALDAVALDHTPVAAGEPRVFGEQLGPGRSSRALAIVHIAMFDAVNAVSRRYQGYTGLGAAPARTSPDAAVAQAAHDTLVALYPSQTGAFGARLEEELDRLRDGVATRNGIALGQRAATAILALRASDGAAHPEPRVGVSFFPSPLPGAWRPDPIGRSPLALGANWGQVARFVVDAAADLPPQPPPALDSIEYAESFNEVVRLGGDGIVTPTERTADQTNAGLFWAYDGTPGLGTPPRLYNQLAVHIADRRHIDAVDLARLLALANVAMADVGISCWSEKYVHQFWRPITGIREADEGTGPTGLGDGNPATAGNATFTPLGAPASNLRGPSFTPPFPAYASGHAAFGSALFQVLRRFYGTDRIPFTFVSDELNGATLDRTGEVRPLLPRHFTSLSAAEAENGQSRIYLGIHWQFDNTRGTAAGRHTGNYVFEHAFRPVRRH